MFGFLFVLLIPNWGGCEKRRLTTLQNEKFTPPTKEILADYDIKWDLAFHGEKGYMDVSYSPFFWPTTSKCLTLHALYPQSGTDTACRKPNQRNERIWDLHS